MSDVAVLKRCYIFHDIADIKKTLQEVHAFKKHYDKGETIVMEGDDANTMGIILQGRVRILRNDINGNRTIVDQMGPAQIFGETFACANIKTYPVSVEAVSASDIMFIQPKEILANQTDTQLISNLLSSLASKNLVLNNKLTIMSKRSTKEKLMMYLYSRAKYHQTNAFDIPFNRQELADYLGVDRSALSAELSKLKQAGVLDYKKNHFVLK